MFNLRKLRGSTLVEVMVAMGIASGLILAVMEAVTMVTRSARNVQVSADWTALIGNITTLFNNGPLCDTYFTSASFSFPNSVGGYFSPAGTNTTVCSQAGVAAWAAGFAQAGVDSDASCASTNGLLSSIWINTNTTANTLISTAVAVGGIRAVQIGARIVPGSQTYLQPYGAGASLLKDIAQLEIYARKADASGKAMVGGTSGLYVGWNNGKQNALAFTVYRNTSAPYAVAHCNITDLLTQACSDLKGTYVAGANPPCQIPTLFIGQPTGSAPFSAPTLGTGQRLSIWSAGTWGTATANDYAIGMDSAGGTNKTMWFNAGAAGGGFNWVTGSGATSLMNVTATALNVGETTNVAGAVNASQSVLAGTWMSSGSWIQSGTWIYAPSYIDAGDSMYAGTSITANTYMAAGTTITAGSSITAGTSVTAGTSLVANNPNPGWGLLVRGQSSMKGVVWADSGLSTGFSSPWGPLNAYHTVDLNLSGGNTTVHGGLIGLGALTISGNTVLGSPGQGWTVFSGSVFFRGPSHKTYFGASDNHYIIDDGNFTIVTAAGQNGITVWSDGRVTLWKTGGNVPFNCHEEYPLLNTWAGSGYAAKACGTGIPISGTCGCCTSGTCNIMGCLNDGWSLQAWCGGSSVSNIWLMCCSF